MTTHINKDGLEVWYNLDRAKVKRSGSTSATPKVVAFNVDAADLGEVGVVALHDKDDAVIPAGSYIVRSSLVTEEQFASGGAATLDIGLIGVTNDPIDSGGIDVGISVADLGKNAAVANDGAMVNGTVTTGDFDGHILLTVGTAGFTSGKARLLVWYV